MPRSALVAAIVAVLAGTVAQAQLVVGRIDTPGLRPQALALYETGNRLFVFDDAVNAVRIYDASSLQALGSVALSFDTVISMVVDESRGRLYVGCFCPGVIANFVAVIDAGQGTLVGYLASSGYTKLEGDEARDRVYASYNGGVSVIDAASDTITPISGITGGNLYTSMGVNPVTHELFVSNWSQNGGVLYVVDGTTLAVSTVPNMAGMSVGVNWTENKAYVAYCSGNRTCIYDRDTGAVTSVTTDNDSANEPVFNPATNRLHSTAEVNRVSTIFEGADNAFFNVDFGTGGNSAVAARHATANVYYAMPGSTWVMDGVTARIVAKLDVGPPGYGVAYQDFAVNQAKGLVYVINDDNFGVVTVIRDFARQNPSDFDGDRRTDLAVYQPSSGLWYVRSSRTGATTALGYGGPSYLPLSADFDGDRRTDVAVYETATGLWYVRRSSNGSDFALGYGGSGYTPVPADYDGDGQADLAVYHAATGLWFERRSASSTTTAFGYGGTGYEPVPADYDGDGYADPAVYHTASGLWYIRQSTTGTDRVVGFGGAAYRPLPRDYDGDGQADVAVYHEASGLWFVLASGTGTTSAQGYGGTGYAPVPGDYDGDGQADFAVYHRATGLWFVRPSGGGPDLISGFGGAGYQPVNP